MQALETFDGRGYDAQIPESIPSEDYLTLKQYLTYAAPSLCGDMPLSFAAHLKKIKGKTSGRCLAGSVGIDQSTLSRLLNLERTPKLEIAAKIIENADLSDEYAYQVIADASTVEVSACRRVFSNQAPALTGSVAEQFKGYRSARDLSQRQLAERANFDHASVSRLESDKGLPTLPMFANLAFVLGLNARQVRGFLRTAAASGK
jgi:transcriptional regulator with XRE-family HTH domain